MFACRLRQSTPFGKTEALASKTRHQNSTSFEWSLSRIHVSKSESPLDTRHNVITTRRRSFSSWCSGSQVRRWLTPHSCVSRHVCSCTFAASDVLFCHMCRGDVHFSKANILYHYSWASSKVKNLWHILAHPHRWHIAYSYSANCLHSPSSYFLSFGFQANGCPHNFQVLLLRCRSLVTLSALSSTWFCIHAAKCFGLWASKEATPHFSVAGICLAVFFVARRRCAYRIPQSSFKSIRALHQSKSKSLFLLV